MCILSCHLSTCIPCINLIYFDFIKILKMVTDSEKVSVCFCVYRAKFYLVQSILYSEVNSSIHNMKPTPL